MRQVILVVAAVLAVAFVILPSADAIVCTKNFCATVRCRNVTVKSCAKEGLTYVKDGGVCGCCSACIKILKNGEACPTESLRGAPPTVVCEKGSVCRDGICCKEETRSVDTY